MDGFVDVVRERSADDVAYWLSQCQPSWHQRIEAAAIDPHAGTSRSSRDTTVTVDLFNAVKLANAVIDDVRRRTQQSTLGQRGQKDDPLYRTRGLMTRGWEREVHGFRTTRISTGPVEAQNLVTETPRRIAHGMRNFDNYHLRVLLHSGVKWDTRPTARIRWRSLRLVA
jgi:transposase